MAKKRVKFLVEYETRLDKIPGWGYNVEDWHSLAKSEVMRQTNYNPTCTVLPAPSGRDGLYTKAKFAIEYEVDLDSLPGWGHQVEDWHYLATRQFLLQQQYKVAARVVLTEAAQPVSQPANQLTSQSANQLTS